MQAGRERAGDHLTGGGGEAAHGPMAGVGGHLSLLSAAVPTLSAQGYTVKTARGFWTTRSQPTDAPFPSCLEGID